MSGSLGYDQFMSAAPASADTGSGNAGPSVGYDDFMKAPPPVPVTAGGQPAAKTGMLANVGAGLVEGGSDALNVLSDPFGNLIGKPVGAALTTMHDVVAPWFGGQKFTPEARADMVNDSVPQPGTRTANAVGSVMGAPSPDQVVPSDGAQSLARSGVRGAAGVAALAGTSLAGKAGAALVGGASGVASEVAGNAVPPEYAPAASVAAGLGTGAVVGGGMTLGRAGANVAGKFLAPMTEAGRRGAVGDMLWRGAADPNTALDALNRDTAQLGMGTAPSEIVPGSRPTTYQLTGDAGLGAVENAARVRNRDAFIDRSNEQNAARVQSLEGQAPANASPESVGTFFRGALDRMTADDQAATQRDTQAATQAVDALPGNLPTAPGQAETALQTIGGRLRQGLDTQSQGTKSAASALFEAVDPDGTMRVNMDPIRAAADNIAAQRTPMAKPFSADESSIYQAAKDYSGVQPFSFARDFRSRITDTIRDARDSGDMQAVRRLGEMLRGVDDTLMGGVSEQAVRDTAAVARGAMPSEDAIMARLQSQVSDYYARRSAANAGGSDGASYPAGGGTRPTGVPGPGGAASAPGGRSGNSAGSPGLQSGAPLDANFDADAAARYSSARSAWRDWVNRYVESPGVGEVLKRTGGGDFKVLDSRVAGALFKPGPGAAERIQAYLDAGGNPGALGDAAAYSLRQSAVDADGTLNVARYNRWLGQHREAMNAFSDLARQFQSAAQARQTLDANAATRATQIAEFQKSVAGKFLGEADPVSTMGRLLKGDKAIADMRELARRTASDPAARAGVQRLIVDHLLRDYIGNKAAGETGTNVVKSDAFQTFIKKNARALEEVLSPEQVQAIRNIGLDLQRANKSVAGSSAPGQSNTAHNLADAAKHGAHGQSVLSQVVMAEAIGHVAEGVAGPLGRVAGIATVVGNAMRQAGMTKINDLLTEAMLNPQLAKALMAKASESASIQQGRSISRLILATAAQQGASLHAVQKQPERQDFGIATPPTAPRYVPPAKRAASSAFRT